MLLQSDSAWGWAIPVSLRTAALPQQTHSHQVVCPSGLELPLELRPSLWPARCCAAFSGRLPSAHGKWMRLLTFIEIQTVMSQADFSVNILHQKCFSFLLPASHSQTRAHTHTHTSTHKSFPSFSLPSLLSSFQPCGAVSLGSFTRVERRKVH